MKQNPLRGPAGNQLGKQGLRSITTGGKIGPLFHTKWRPSRKRCLPVKGGQTGDTKWANTRVPAGGGVGKKGTAIGMRDREEPSVVGDNQKIRRAKGPHVPGN